MEEEEARSSGGDSAVALPSPGSSDGGEGLSEFWRDPLSQWVRDALCAQADWSPRPISYLDLCNAAVLNTLLRYMHPRSSYEDVGPCEEDDVGGRLRNLASLLRNLQGFYQEVLRQLIVMPLPDLLSIARHPFPEGSGYEMKKVMLLMLGCAVQSERKEEFVGRIKELELSLQHAIVEQIQRVTAGAECVLNVSALELDPADAATATVLHQLQAVVKERDAYAHTVHELSQDHESDSSSAASACACAQRRLPESQQHDAAPHAAMELLETKARLRKATNEMDGQAELILELREELSGKESELDRVQAERIQLLRDSRTAKDLRDELDAAQAAAAKAERLEVDNGRLRERLSELDFFRSRVDELRSENHILLETRGVLEEQLDDWKARAAAATEAEMRVLEAQKTSHGLQAQLREEREKAADLVEEARRAEREATGFKERLTQAETELAALMDPSTPRANQGSIGSQLADSVQARLRELELENQKLRARSDGGLTGTSELIAALQDENQSLISRLDATRDAAALSQSQVLAETRLQADLEAAGEKAIRLRSRLESTEAALVEARALVAADTSKELAAKATALEAELGHGRDRLASLEDENRRWEKEAAGLRGQIKELEGRVLEQEEAKIGSETASHALEREARCLRREKALLKEKLSVCDEEFEAARSRLIELERSAGRVETLEARLEAAQSQIAEAEVEKRALSSSLEVEARKTSRLGSDLVAAKLAGGELSSRLGGLLGAMGLEEGGGDAEVLARWSASQRELAGLRLKFAQGEGLLGEAREELAAARDAVAALEAQRTSAAGPSSRSAELEREVRSGKEQVGILQEKLRRITAQLQTRDAEATAARQELTDHKIQLASLQALQTENAKLQVSMRNSELQEDLLRQDNEELQKQVSSLDSQNSSVRRDFEKLQRLHGQTLGDYEQLQSLHEGLSADYEKVKRELKELRARLKEVGRQDAALSGSVRALEAERRSCAEAKRLLSEERVARERELRGLAVLQSEHSELRRRFEAAQCRAEVLAEEAKGAVTSERRQKEAAAAAGLRATQAEGRAADAIDVSDRKELDIVKLQHRCEMMAQLNTSLEEESRALMRQLEILIQQNQDLLHRALRDKDSFHAEEKELQEKMNALRRHKDKLEEKIMEQIKYSDVGRRSHTNSPSFVKRAAKALMPRSSSRSKSKMLLGGPATSSGEDNSSIQSTEDPSGGFLARNSSTASFTAATRPLSTNRTNADSTNDGSDGSHYASIRGRRRSRTDLSNSSPQTSNGVIPPPPSANRSSACHTTESSLSSSGGSSDGRRQLGSPGRISWAGSERGVDVAFPNREPSPRARPVAALPPRPPPNRALPPPPPPPKSAVGSLRGRPPPPYPAATKPPSRAGSVMSTSICSNGSRAPPPPYPGSVRSVDHYANPSRMARSLTADTFNDPASTRQPPGFSPQKTSTPKQGLSPATPNASLALPPNGSYNDSGGVFRSNGLHPGQNSLSSSVQLRPSRFPSEEPLRPASAALCTSRSDPEETPRRSLRAARAVSLYENLDDLDVSAATATDVLDPQTPPKKDSTIWYEYGCV